MLPAAIEETLRLDPPLIGWLRTTTRPLTLAGTDLPAGARLLLLMHSAARDEAHGVHAPETFDHRRTGTPPTLNFGAGIHYCPGARYTRLVAGRTLSALARALPGLALTARSPLPARPASSCAGPPCSMSAGSATTDGAATGFAYEYPGGSGRHSWNPPTSA